MTRDSCEAVGKGLSWVYAQGVSRVVWRSEWPSVLVAGRQAGPEKTAWAGSEGRGAAVRGQMSQRHAMHRRTMCQGPAAWEVGGTGATRSLSHSAPIQSLRVLTLHTNVTLACIATVPIPFSPRQFPNRILIPGPLPPPLFVANVLIQMLRRFHPGSRLFSHFLYLCVSIFLPSEDFRFL